MPDDLRKNLIEAIGFVAAFIIIPLGWLIFDFSMALKIYIIFCFAVTEIIFIISLIVKFGDRKENWFDIISIPLFACILIFL